MMKLLVCIDGSGYADNVCLSAAWVAKKLNAQIDLLHVCRAHADYKAPGSDHTGSIGLGARSELLEELTKIDEERGKLDQAKGRMILQHAQEVLEKEGMEKIESLHRRGNLTDTVKEMESNVDMIFIGKRGEHANRNSDYLGANLEKTARAVHKPLFIATTKFEPIETILIAYDGKDHARQAVDFVASSSLFKDCKCHLLAVDSSAHPIDTSASEEKLKAAGIELVTEHVQDSQPDQAIISYVETNNIDLLLTGAYSHSRMRSLLLGSTTASMIKSCKIPLLMFR